jgi:hypothetical protein
MRAQALKLTAHLTRGGAEAKQQNGHLEVPILGSQPPPKNKDNTMNLGCAVPVQLRGLEVRRVAPATRASSLTAQELRGLIVRATLSTILTSGRPDETLIMWISWAQFVHAPAGYGRSSR